MRYIELGINRGERHDVPKRRTALHAETNGAPLEPTPVLETGPGAVTLFAGDGNYVGTPIGDFSLRVNQDEQTVTLVGREITGGHFSPVTEQIVVFNEGPKRTRFGAVMTTENGPVTVNLPEVNTWPSDAIDSLDRHKPALRPGSPYAPTNGHKVQSGL